jgi:UDP:flavonoid glycosyltransferase YjiC (YdhE family)
MAHILTVTSGLPSIRYPTVELARRLAAAGHRLTCASIPDDRGLVEHQGLAFLPLDPSGYEQFLDTDARAGALHRLLTLRHRREQARDSMAAGSFVGIVRDLAPDLLLVNGEMHEHIIAVSATGVPMALLNVFVSIWRQPGLPPPHHPVRPGVGWLGTRAGTALLWQALRARKRGRACAQYVRRIGCDYLSVLKQLARDTAFDFRRETDDSQWLIPFTYRRLPVLSLHAVEFEFPHRPPERVHYVGPMVLESRTDRPQTAADRAELGVVFARCRRAGGGRTLVYAGFGSAFSTDRAFLQRLLGAVAARPDWDLVVSLGGRLAPGDLGPVPENVHAFAWVPQLDVLKHADVAVTHGGINTIDECVLNGVPALVYCGSETDMAGTTARVVHHGIGIAGDRRRDETADIRAHIDRLLRDPRFGQNVRRLQRCYATYAEQRVAERAVASLLERGMATGTADRGRATARGGAIS